MLQNCYQYNIFRGLRTIKSQNYFHLYQKYHRKHQLFSCNKSINNNLQQNCSTQRSWKGVLDEANRKHLLGFTESNIFLCSCAPILIQVQISYYLVSHSYQNNGKIELIYREHNVLMLVIAFNNAKNYSK